MSVDWKAMYEQALRKKGEAFDRAVRAERERDAAVARAEQLEKKLAKVMSDYQDVEDERDEWKACAEAAERDRDDDYSERSQKAAAWDRVAAHPALRMDLLPEADHTYAGGVLERITQLAEAEQAVDPIEAKARELYRVATPDARWETVADEYRRIAAHIIEREAGDE